MISAGLVLADSDGGKGSPIGLLVVLLLVIAVYFLWRSMNRHLKNVATPPEDAEGPKLDASSRDQTPPDQHENGPSAQG